MIYPKASDLKQFFVEFTDRNTFGFSRLLTQRSLTEPLDGI